MSGSRVLIQSSSWDEISFCTNEIILSSLTALMAGFLFDTDSFIFFDKKSHYGYKLQKTINSFFIMKLNKLEDSKTAWNYIFIFNAGISLLSGMFIKFFFDCLRAKR